MTDFPILKTVSETPGCNDCPMQKLYPGNTFVKPYEGKELRLAIGEAPGAQEAEQGIPFVGGSGRWLDVFYRKAGMKFEDISRVNCIQCRPEDNHFITDSSARKHISEADAHKAVEHCFKAHVEPFLKSRPWKRVDVFGDKPLKLILGKTSGITNWRTTPLPVPCLGPELKAIATFHPAYVARDQTMIPIVINDLKRSLSVDPENYEIYPSLQQVKDFRATRFAFDIETKGWHNNEITMVGLSAAPYSSIVVPFTGEYIEELRRIFRNADEVVCQNGLQFDIPILAKQGITIRGPKECKVWDIMLMHHLRFSKFPHDLEFIGKQFTNKGHWKSDKAIEEIYNARDVDVTWRCFGQLKKLLEQAKLLDVYLLVSWPLALICKSMTDAGVIVSGSRLKELRTEYLTKIFELEQSLPAVLRPFDSPIRRRALAPEGAVGKSGKPIKYVMVDDVERVTPWRSVDVKMKYLYETLKLPVQRHIKTKQPTVDKGALDKLFTKTKHPVLRILKDLNKYATLLSGFLKEDINKSEYLHPSFNVHGTSTGRLSSSGPNFQNQAYKVRFMYVSRFENGSIIAADFSGIENRITAWLANDKPRLEWLKDPEYSEHKRLVGSFYGIPYAEVEKSHDPLSPYAICKRICHGTNYCMGAKKIAETYDLDFTTVRDLQYTWKKEIQGTTYWQRSVMNNAQRTGMVENKFGRKMWIWEAGSGPQAVAFHPQSNAAEVIFRSMIGLMYKKIGWPADWARKVCPYLSALPDQAVMIAQVHDELVLDSPPELIEECKQSLKITMSQPWQELDGMVLPAAINNGPSYGDCGE